MKKSRHRSTWGMKTVVQLLAFGILLLSACTQHAPKRSFTTVDLLVDLSKMPSSWQVKSPPGKVTDHLSTDDSAKIGFSITIDSQPYTAAQRVYRYRNKMSAQKVFEKHILPLHIGETPPTWKYQSLLAEQSRFTCTYQEERNASVCRWSGQYEEYIVTFQSWMPPDSMTLEDMEHVIQAIDARMAQYLDEAFEGTDD